MPLQISDQGLRLMQLFESFRPTPYPDQRGYMTVGYGHVLTTPDGRAISNQMAGWSTLVAQAMQRKFGARVITQAQANQVMREDLAHCEAVVNADALAPTQAQFDAMVSLTFNIGSGGFGGSSVRRMHNAGQRNIAPFDIAKLCEMSKAKKPPTCMAQAFAAWSETDGAWNLGLFRRRVTEAMVYRGDDPESAYRIMEAFNV